MATINTGNDVDDAVVNVVALLVAASQDDRLGLEFQDEEGVRIIGVSSPPRTMAFPMIQVYPGTIREAAGGGSLSPTEVGVEIHVMVARGEDEVQQVTLLQQRVRDALVRDSLLSPGGGSACNGRFDRILQIDRGAPGGYDMNGNEIAGGVVNVTYGDDRNALEREGW